jgi:hypothetical protein
MLMLFVEENGFHGMPRNCGGETGTATKINEIGGQATRWRRLCPSKAF